GAATSSSSWKWGSSYSLLGRRGVPFGSGGSDIGRAPACAGSLRATGGRATGRIVWSPARVFKGIDKTTRAAREVVAHPPAARVPRLEGLRLFLRPLRRGLGLFLDRLRGGPLARQREGPGRFPLRDQLEQDRIDLLHLQPPAQLHQPPLHRLFLGEALVGPQVL